MRNRKDIHEYESGLGQEDALAYRAYLGGLRADIDLDERQRDAILADISAAFQYYSGQGLSARQAAERMGEGLLGGFYSRAELDKWYSLDSAAKVYPLSIAQECMSVYRLAVYLEHEVQPAILQVALLSTIKRFPTFATTVKNGFFWNYLDATRKRFEVEQEKGLPCQPLKVGGRHAHGFRVLYWGRRISFEAFHILADGTGALTFLKTLTREYLRLMGRDIPLDKDIFCVSDSPDPAEYSNDFPLADKADRAEGFTGAPAVQLKGRRSRLQPARVQHIVMDTAKLRAASKSHGTTVTGFMASAIFLASAHCARKREGNLAMQIPANMRSHYPSKTLRNFSMFCIVRIPCTQATDMETIVPLVNTQLREGTTKQSLDRMMNMTNKLVGNPYIRYTPLPLKRAAYRYGYSLFGDRAQTTALSNLGVVQNDFQGEVGRFDAVLSANLTNKANCALISYRDKAVLSITKSTHDNGFENRLCEILQSYGVITDVETIDRSPQANVDIPGRKAGIGMNTLRKGVLASFAAALLVCILANIAIGGKPIFLYVLLAEYITYTTFFSKASIEASYLQKFLALCYAICTFFMLADWMGSGGQALTRTAVPITYACMMVLSAVYYIITYKSQHKNLQPMAALVAKACVCALFGVVGPWGINWPRIALLAFSLAAAAFGLTLFRKPVIRELRIRFTA